MVGGRELYMQIFKSLALKLALFICKRRSLGFFRDRHIRNNSDVATGDYMDKQVITCVVVCLLTIVISIKAYYSFTVKYPEQIH